MKYFEKSWRLFRQFFKDFSSHLRLMKVGKFNLTKFLNKLKQNNFFNLKFSFINREIEKHGVDYLEIRTFGLLPRVVITNFLFCCQINESSPTNREPLMYIHNKNLKL